MHKIEAGTLKTEFLAYRADARLKQKEHTNTVTEKRRAISERLRIRKKQIRSQSLSWDEKRHLMSVATAESIIERKRLNSNANLEREKLRPQPYQFWVGEKAKNGDKRAAAQLRGWRYQDQRNIRKLEQRNSQAGEVVHFSGLDASDESTWADLTNDRLIELKRNEKLARTIESTRWAINRRTGDTVYIIQGKEAIVDRGQVISVLDSEEASIVLGLEMAVKKYGPLIRADGSDQWRQKVAIIAARNNIFVRFADPEMQETLAQEKSAIGLLATRQQRYGDLAERIARQPSGLQLKNRDEANLLLTPIYGRSRAMNYIDDLQKGMTEGDKRTGRIRDTLTLTVLRSTKDSHSYLVQMADGKANEVIALLNEARQKERAVPIAKSFPKEPRERTQSNSRG